MLDAPTSHRSCIHGAGSDAVMSNDIIKDLIQADAGGESRQEPKFRGTRDTSLHVFKIFRKYLIIGHQLRISAASSPLSDRGDTATPIMKYFAK